MPRLAAATTIGQVATAAAAADSIHTTPRRDMAAARGTPDSASADSEFLGSTTVSPHHPQQQQQQQLRRPRQGSSSSNGSHAPSHVQHHLQHSHGHHADSIGSPHVASSLGASLVSTPDARSTRASLAAAAPPPMSLPPSEQQQQHKHKQAAPQHLVRPNFRYRYNVYGMNVAGKAAKSSDMYTLQSSSMPPIAIFDRCGRTPQPKHCLVHSIFYSNEALTAIALEAMPALVALQQRFDSGATAKATFVIGQTQFVADSMVHLGMMRVLNPGVAMTTPTIHQAAGHAAGNRKLNTGLLHAAVAAADIDRVVVASHQRAYYDVDGVWIAHTAAAIRELALFEKTMRFYRNGVRTSRPMAPITVEPARSNHLGTANHHHNGSPAAAIATTGANAASAHHHHHQHTPSYAQHQQQQASTAAGRRRPSARPGAF